MPAGRADDRTGQKRNLFRNAQKVVLRHIERAKHGKPPTENPDFLWFVVMATGSLCMGLMIWGAYCALPRFGRETALGREAIPLRASTAGSRLKGSSDVPVRWVREAGSPLVPPQTPPLIPPVAQPPVTPAPLPPPPEPRITEQRLPAVDDHPRPALPPAPVDPPLAPLPERKDPVIFTHANLGDTPMIRTWKKLAETSFLLAAFSSATANNLLAQIPDRVSPDYSKQIEALTHAVQTLSDQVNQIKIDERLNAVKNELNDKIAKIKIEGPRDNSNEFLLLANRLDQMEKLLSQMMKTPASPAPALAAGGNLEEIKLKLGNIEQAILKLQPTEKRIALAAPSPEPAIVAKPNTSNVIFVNLYDQDLWLWVNQKQHRVPANTTLTLDNIPAGPATIEVRSPEGIFHKSNPTLVADETFTLTAR